MNHLGTRNLETERLRLRRFESADAEAVFRNWASDPEVTKYLMWPTHSDVHVTESVLREWIGHYDDKNFYQWAIVLKSNGDEPIGTIGISKQDERTSMVHIGYCIGRNWWNQGVTSEALARLVRYFFEEVEVNRMESRHDPRNSASGLVMKKCGLIHEGTMKQGDWNNLGICDYAMYGLVKEDYTQG